MADHDRITGHRPRPADRPRPRPARWAATSTSRPCRAPAPASSWPCPGRPRSIATSLGVALVRALATEEIRLEERAVLRAIRASEFEPHVVPTPLAGHRPSAGPTLMTGPLPADDEVEARPDRRRRPSVRGAPSPAWCGSTPSTAAPADPTRPRPPDGTRGAAGDPVEHAARGFGPGFSTKMWTVGGFVDKSVDTPLTSP